MQVSNMFLGMSVLSRKVKIWMFSISRFKMKKTCMQSYHIGLPGYCSCGQTKKKKNALSLMSVKEGEKEERKEGREEEEERGKEGGNGTTTILSLFAFSFHLFQISFSKLAFVLNLCII